MSDTPANTDSPDKPAAAGNGLPGEASISLASLKLRKAD